MLNFLYIVFICYAAIFVSLIPPVFYDIGVEWVVFYALLVAFLASILLKKVALGFNLLVLFMAFYAVVVLASVSWTPYEGYTLFNLERIFARYVSPVIVAIISSSILMGRHSAEKFVKHLCLSAIFLSLIAIFQMLTGWGMENSKELRASAFFHNPNGLAVFLVMLLPPFLYAFEIGYVSSKLRWPATGLVILGILSTASRKGLATMILTFLIYFSVKRQFKKLIALLVVTVFIVAGAGGYFVITKRVKEATPTRELKARWGAALLGFRMFADHPLAGLGYRGYINNSARYRGTRFGRTLEAHNNYATILSSYGLLGFVPYIMIFLYPFVKGMNALRKCPLSDQDCLEQRNIATILVSVVPAFMINAWFAGGLYSNWIIVNVLYAILIMCLLRLKALHG